MINHKCRKENEHRLDNRRWDDLLFSVIPVVVQAFKSLEEYSAQKGFVDSNSLEDGRSQK